MLGLSSIVHMWRMDAAIRRSLPSLQRRRSCRVFRLDQATAQGRYRNPVCRRTVFRVWVPQPYPDAALRIVPGETPRFVYCRKDDFWTMPPPAPSGFWTDRLDIREVDSREALVRELGNLSSMAGLGEAADGRQSLPAPMTPLFSRISISIEPTRRPTR